MDTSRGGARPNAGRKKQHNGVLYVRMHPDTIASIKYAASCARLSMAEYLTTIHEICTKSRSQSQNPISR